MALDRMPDGRAWAKRMRAGLRLNAPPMRAHRPGNRPTRQQRKRAAAEEAATALAERASGRHGRSFLRDERGMSDIVQFLFMFLLLLGFFGGFAAYATALHARSVVIQAAFAADRTASIECGPNSPGYTADWYQNAVGAAQQALQDGGLTLKAFAPTGNTPGTWYVSLSACGSGTAAVTAQVSYQQLDLFPVLGPVLLAGQASGPSLLVTDSTALPVE